MKYEEILPIAEKYLKKIEPYCLRAMIAGSIRREKKHCNDIELVIVIDSEMMTGIIEEVGGLGEHVRGDITGRYTQRLLPEGVKIDIFIAGEDNWGNILVIRTGSAEFSHAMMLKARRVGLRHKDGSLWRDTERLICRSEDQFFEYLQMDWIDPADRSW